MADGPGEDPYATDPAALHASLHASRRAILGLGPALVVPGRGAAFAPTGSSPRRPLSALGSHQRSQDTL
ncbi:hypothetical protein SGFS_081200 [Streptomyces graminofaciens]|uniref:Uncharacterized protein n=1 Tax=Streptomyces graminofaciens TaxID=68212 RepID=A0ABN5VXJ8_9ACTN|nr:hypothetical protein [Streptomyces graminofaciens]BBC36826.1 hypothetical protein SGFS_081200 [Streptomyces graminofaciens]